MWQKTDLGNISINSISVGKDSANWPNPEREYILIGWSNASNQGGIKIFYDSVTSWSEDHGRPILGVCWNTTSTLLACGVVNNNTDKIVARYYVFNLSNLYPTSNYSTAWNDDTKNCIVDISGNYKWAGGERLSKWASNSSPPIIEEVTISDGVAKLLERDNEYRLYCGVGANGAGQPCTVLKRINPNDGTTIWSKPGLDFGSIVAS